MDNKVQSDLTDQLFRAIDGKDADGFAAHLTPDATFQFGNAPVVTGRDSVREIVHQFFAAIAAVKHTIHEKWVEPDTIICRGEVAYTRHDDSVLQVPFANILKLRGDLIHDYLIYVDTSQLFATA